MLFLFHRYPISSRLCPNHNQQSLNSHLIFKALKHCQLKLEHKVNLVHLKPCYQLDHNIHHNRPFPFHLHLLLHWPPSRRQWQRHFQHHKLRIFQLCKFLQCNLHNLPRTRIYLCPLLLIHTTQLCHPICLWCLCNHSKLCRILEYSVRSYSHHYHCHLDQLQDNLLRISFPHR